MYLAVGCAMWTHKAWPWHSLPSAERLRAYSSWCTAVEGNTTFYATPPLATARSWAAQTSPDFRFIPKFPRTVTHERRFTGVEADVRAFLDAVEPLGRRASALWVQLPSAFAPADVPALATFLRRLPRSFRYAVEVRHPAFFADATTAGALEQVLAAAGAEWLPFDTTEFFRTPPSSDDERDAWTKKPRVARRDTALTDRPIVRYLGRDDPARTVEGWRPWVETVAGWLREGRSPTVFLHTPDNAAAPQLARRFHDDVRAAVPALEPLPEPAPIDASPAEPLTLF
ncbi:DUF72 domain-containing protein [Cryptosporangium phraense]|uniref:DUF72 domain-containing protein n=1 Tax=Cryptosporangium phraense TaxID=2593070 RepID=A0A545AKU5_9ACTN|nr:DUF72 domain-containing protein [Cryptosporangium phraense]TQS41946.1 DUF72 domain-containing protein [Cryptosporangium phraense]